MLSEKLQKIRFRHGAGIVEALDPVGSAADQRFGLRFGFDALRHHFTAHVMEKVEHGVDDEGRAFVVGVALDQAFVQLDAGKRAVEHGGQVGIAGAEIIQGEPEAHLLQPVHDLVHPRDILGQDALCQLQLQAAGIEVILIGQLLQLRDQAGGHELLHGQVYGDGGKLIRIRFGQKAADVLQDEAADLGDQTVLFRKGNEDCRRDGCPVGIHHPDKGLRHGKAAGGAVTDGLIPHLEQAFPDRALHPLDDLIALFHFPVNLFVEADHVVGPFFCQRQAEIQEFQNIGGVPVLIGADKIRKRGVQDNVHVIDAPGL